MLYFRISIRKYIKPFNTVEESHISTKSSHSGTPLSTPKFSMNPSIRSEWDGSDLFFPKGKLIGVLKIMLACFSERWN